MEAVGKIRSPRFLHVCVIVCVCAFMHVCTKPQGIERSYIHLSPTILNQGTCLEHLRKCLHKGRGSLNLKNLIISRPWRNGSGAEMLSHKWLFFIIPLVQPLNWGG